MILFLVKHSRPDIANETRKRSKTNYSVNPAAFHKLLCVMMFVLDMKNLGFKANWGCEQTLGDCLFQQ